MSESWGPAHEREARARLLEVAAHCVRKHHECDELDPLLDESRGGTESAERFREAVDCYRRYGFDGIMELARLYENVSPTEVGGIVNEKRTWTKTCRDFARARLLELQAQLAREGREVYDPDRSMLHWEESVSAERFSSVVALFGFDSTRELARVYEEVAQDSVPVRARCIARSWTGRECNLRQHVDEDPVHQAADGVRWRGDADTTGDGSATLPPALRAATLAMIEAQTSSDDSHTARRRVLQRQSGVLELLWAECGVPPRQDSYHSDEEQWNAFKAGYQKAADDIAHGCASFTTEPPYSGSLCAAWNEGYGVACCAYRLGSDLNQMIADDTCTFTERLGVVLIPDLLDNSAYRQSCRPDPRGKV